MDTLEYIAKLLLIGAAYAFFVILIVAWFYGAHRSFREPWDE